MTLTITKLIIKSYCDDNNKKI